MNKALSRSERNMRITIFYIRMILTYPMSKFEILLSIPLYLGGKKILVKDIYLNYFKLCFVKIEFAVESTGFFSRNFR